jgi:hypothetical protein
LLFGASESTEEFMVLLLTIASLIAWADVKPERLPGSDLSVVQARRQASYVIEAKILHLGECRPDPLQVGGLHYPQVVIEASRAFKGDPTRWAQPAARKVGFLLTENDTVPREGEVYILYIENMNRSSYIFKVTRPDGAIPVRVSGSDLSVAEAEKEALYVIEAKIQDLGELARDPNPPRGLVYPRVAIEPSKVIKGADKAAALAIREVRLAFTRDETVLENGRTYTLYLREAFDGFEVFRFTQRSQDRPVRLPGSDLSVAEAESRALYVVEARILQLGELQEDHSRPRGIVYPQVAIKPSKVIRERQEGNAQSRRRVRLILTEDETIPDEGETYTLYIRAGKRGFEVFKVTGRSPETPR